MPTARLLRRLLGGDSDAQAPAAPSSQTAPRRARNPELEALIRASPTDPTGYLVYADWLQSQGDPRGELVAVQVALTQVTDHDELISLRQRNQRLMESYQDDLLGDVGYHPHARLTWQFGFVREAFLGLERWTFTQTPPSADDLLPPLLSRDVAALLQSLKLGALAGIGYQPSIDHLVDHGPLPALRALHCGVFTITTAARLRIEMGDFSRLWEHLPALETLELNGYQPWLGTPTLPKLKRLILGSSLSLETVRTVMSTPWPGLETLILRIGNQGTQVSDLQPLLSGAAFPDLRHLGLCAFAGADDLAHALPSAKILGQLQTLDLSYSMMTDLGGRALVTNGPAYAHLERLVLEENWLQNTVNPLRQLGEHVRIGRQNAQANVF